MTVLLGAIADDFTGASDLASSLVRAGMRTAQVIGVPAGDCDPGEVDAVVVSLKSRTAPAQSAVADSLAALRWLQGLGARQFYFKYCSTFDSTSEGNIGPVADALTEALGTDFAFVCPAFPANGRTVVMGHLFVGRQRLSESSMKDHPLTPMRDSSLVRLLDAQSRYRSGVIPLDVVAGGSEAVAAAGERLRNCGLRYGVADAVTDRDVATIGAAARSHVLVTGASSLGAALAPNFRAAGCLDASTDPGLPAVTGPAAVLAGSCSDTTRAQVAAWQGRRHAHFRIDARRAVRGEDVVGEALAFAGKAGGRPVLFHSSTDAATVESTHAIHGRARTSSMLEEVMGRLAAGLVAGGARRLVVAGGETSGAVVAALGVRRLRICREIDPGVPWTETLDTPRLALALKSGNFGSLDFFEKALAMLP